MSDEIVFSYTVNKENKQLTFPVLYSNIDINKDLEVKTTRLLQDNTGAAHISTVGTGDAGDTFDFSILTTNTDDIKALDNLYKDMVNFSVVFPPSIIMKTLDSKVKWFITKLDKKQDNKEYVRVDLSLHTYNPPKTPVLLNTNLTSLGNKFNNNCVKKNTSIKYKDKSACVKTMKQILAKCGYDVYDYKNGKKTNNISNQFGKRTAKAVRKFKNQWGYYNLTPKISSRKNYKVDKQTKQALVYYNKLLQAKKNKSSTAKKKSSSSKKSSSKKKAK